MTLASRARLGSYDIVAPVGRRASGPVQVGRCRGIPRGHSEDAAMRRRTAGYQARHEGRGR